MSVTQENKLIALIYKAALNSALWSQVLSTVVEYTQSDSAIFFHTNRFNPANNFYYHYELQTDQFFEYSKDLPQTIKTESLHVKQALSMQIVPSVLGFKQQETSQLDCNSAFFHQNLYDCYAVFALFKNNQQQEYTTLDKLKLQQLSWHLEQALQIRQNFFELQILSGDLSQLFEKMSKGFILLNHQRQVCYVNSQAKQVLNKAEHLVLDEMGQLKTHPKLQNKLDLLIRQILSSVDTSIDEKYENVAMLALYAEEKTKLLKLSMTRFSSNSLQPNRMVAIILSESNFWRKLSPSLTKEVYQLSRREMQVCELLFNGFTIDHISQHCGITVSSVRTYLKNIFSKMNCNSQVELIGLLTPFCIDFENTMV